MNTDNPQTRGASSVNLWQKARPETCAWAVLITMAALLFGSTVQAESSGDRFTSFSGFNLGETTFSEVQAKIGITSIVHTGDAGKSLSSLCYAVDSLGYISFLAGELDGPEKYLGGFYISNRPSRVPCSPWLRRVPKQSLNIGGLRLGMTVSEFKTTVGVPVRWAATQGIASFESKRSMSVAELAKLPPKMQAQNAHGKIQHYYDVVITISATFEFGKLREFRVWKTETR